MFGRGFSWRWEDGFMSIVDYEFMRRFSRSSEKRLVLERESNVIKDGSGESARKNG